MNTNKLDRSFQIGIIEQGWLGEDSSEYDLCSHGLIKLIIGGQLVSSDEIECGISESALALLRTLERDHSPESHVADRLIFHGCGTILMMGCPIGIDWSVRHLAEGVLIDNVVRYDTTNEAEAIRFPGLQVRIPEEHYRRQIVSFAQKAKSLFEGSAKSFSDDFDRKQYETFWEEFNQLLNRNAIALGDG